jgi:6-phosphogluconate dehydrogenase
MQEADRMSAADFGMIGLGTMGRNLALNIESRGFSVAVWNLETDWTDRFVQDHSQGKFVGSHTLRELVDRLERPRRLMMMIPAGAPVDSMIQQLTPLLDPGDIVIDGGNSFFQDTRRREAAMRESRLNFVGCGVSGGEEGARIGPSLMPGGSAEAWARIKDVLEAIAAKTEAGACVTHVGPDGAGHFVKMVHNGIEYGDMQLIAEAYDVLHRGLGLTTPEAGDVFDDWNRGPLESFLIELTAHVCRVKDPETGTPLVDMIQDKAGQKGTGKWTAQVALDLAVAIPTISAALDARILSSLKDQRVAAEREYSGSGARGPGSAFGDRARTMPTCRTRCMPPACAVMRRAWRSLPRDRRSTSGTSTSRRWGGSGRGAASSAQSCSIRCGTRSSALQGSSICWSTARSARRCRPPKQAGDES